MASRFSPLDLLSEAAFSARASKTSPFNVHVNAAVFGVLGAMSLVYGIFFGSQLLHAWHLRSSGEHAQANVTSVSSRLVTTRRSSHYDVTFAYTFTDRDGTRHGRTALLSYNSEPAAVAAGRAKHRVVYAASRPADNLFEEEVAQINDRAKTNIPLALAFAMLGGLHMIRYAQWRRSRKND